MSHSYIVPSVDKKNYLIQKSTNSLMKIERNINVSFKFYAYDSDENMIF